MKRWAHWSLRRTLLVVLLPGLLAVMGLELTVSWRNALAAANAAFDRSLLGAIKAMDANISTASGGLAVELPYRMLEFFELTANGQVFYRVASGDGLVDIGNAELPDAPLPLVDGQPQFHDADYFGTPVRVGSYARRLERPLSQGSLSDRVVIQVAETLDSRQDFTRRLVWETVARDALLLASALALVVLAVHTGLRPLQRLRADVAQRHNDDLTPINPDQVPKDVRPLVDAINLHMQRTRQVLQQQRAFIDDASHQLRTPLTTIIGYSELLERSGDGLSERGRGHAAAVRAAATQLARSIDDVLDMAQIDADEMALDLEDVDVAELLTEAADRWAREAEQVKVAIKLEHPQDIGLIRGDVKRLAQTLDHLTENAIRQTPPDGVVTLSARRALGEIQLQVSDTGRGIPFHVQAHIFDRFIGRERGGTGLGLALVKALVELHGGWVALESEPGAGATFTCHLPEAAQGAAGHPEFGF